MWLRWCFWLWAHGHQLSREEGGSQEIRGLLLDCEQMASGEYPVFRENTKFITHVHVAYT